VDGNFETSLAPSALSDTVPLSGVLCPSASNFFLVQAALSERMQKKINIVDSQSECGAKQYELPMSLPKKTPPWHREPLKDLSYQVLSETWKTLLLGLCKY
jgi:hypothetical protein